MNLNTWIELGISNGIIEDVPIQEVAFQDVYREWFLMKLSLIRDQSCDRIECTYNKYYAGTAFVLQNVSRINEKMIEDFLTQLLIGAGTVTLKEFRKIYQIVNNVMVYAKDLDLGGAKLLDWEAVKNKLPSGRVVAGGHAEFLIPRNDIEKIMDKVLNEGIYPLKQSACLCLILNFFLGLRVGELASVTWQDIDYERNVIRIYKTETKSFSRDAQGNRNGSLVYRVVENTKTFYSVREVPLLPEALYILQLLKQHHEQCGYSSPYLAYDGVDCILVRSLDRTLRRLCKLCEVNYFNTHAIRKAFASMLHESGMPSRLIADLMGHSEISTTERHYILTYQDNCSMLLGYMSKGLSFSLPAKQLSL